MGIFVLIQVLSRTLGPIRRQSSSCTKIEPLLRIVSSALYQNYSENTLMRDYSRLISLGRVMADPQADEVAEALTALCCFNYVSHCLNHPSPGSIGWIRRKKSIVLARASCQAGIRLCTNKFNDVSARKDMYLAF